MSVLSKLSKWSPTGYLRNLCPNTCGLGIDIGQLHTKLVMAERDGAGSFRYQGVIVPTVPLDTRADHAAASSDPTSASTPERRQGTTSKNGTGTTSCPLSLSTRAIKQLTSRISQAVSTNLGVQQAHVGLTLSMAACDYRTLYIPKSNRVSSVVIQQSIAAAIGDHRPRCVAVIPGQDMQADERQTKIRCFSLSEDFAWTMAHHLDGIGLMPDTLNGNPWCIANALEMVTSPTDKGKVHIGIDWSYGPPTLVSIKDGKIDYVRCLSTGSLRDLTAPATEQFDLAPSEAGRWLAHCLQGPVQLDADAVATETRDWVREACTRLAAEIGTAVEFIRWRNQGTDIDAIWLMGGGAEITELTNLLQSMVPCQLKPWRVGSGHDGLSAGYAMSASLAWMGLNHA